MRRTIVGGVAVFAAAALALSGCGGNAEPDAQPKPAPSSEKPQSTANLLGQSFKKIETESFKFTSTMSVDGVDITSEGAFDLSKKLGTVTMDMAGQEMQMRILGDDMYVEVLGQWMHVDMRKLPAGNTFADAGNPIGNADYLLAASDDVKQTKPGTYEGTLDLKKYAAEHAKPAEAKQLEEMLKDLGPDAQKVPFTATIDDAGRLTSMTTTMKITQDGEKVTVKQVAKYSDFGTKVSVEKPPADKIQEAPSSMYDK